MGGGAAGGAAGAVGAAIGTKAAAGLATAALLTAGAAEIKHVTADKADKDSSPKIAKAAKAAPAPLAALPTAPAEATPPPRPPPPGPDTGEEVVVEPVPADEGDSPDGLTGGLEADGGPKHKKDAVADSDGEAKGTGETAPVGTGLEGTLRRRRRRRPGRHLHLARDLDDRHRADARAGQPAVKPRPSEAGQAKGPAAVKRPAAKRSGSKKKQLGRGP